MTGIVAAFKGGCRGLCLSCKDRPATAAEGVESFNMCFLLPMQHISYDAMAELIEMV
jgi:hypothetical protein